MWRRLCKFSTASKLSLRPQPRDSPATASKLRKERLLLPRPRSELVEKRSPPRTSPPRAGLLDEGMINSRFIPIEAGVGMGARAGRGTEDAGVGMGARAGGLSAPGGRARGGFVSAGLDEIDAGGLVSAGHAQSPPCRPTCSGRPGRLALLLACGGASGEDSRGASS